MYIQNCRICDNLLPHFYFNYFTMSIADINPFFKTTCMVMFCLAVGVAFPSGGTQNALMTATAAIFRKKERLPTQRYALDDWGTTHVTPLQNPRS